MIRSYKGEVWKDYEESFWKKRHSYKVSNRGRVVSFKKNPDGELLEPYKLSGYDVFSCLKKNGKTHLMYVHRVVAMLFLEKDEERTYVIHIDYDKSNNDVKNLKFVNRKELTAHNMKNPAVIEAKKQTLLKPRYSKLNAEKVRLLKKKIFDPNRKTRLRLIAKQFGISEMQLYRIKSGENWGHIEI